MGRKKDLVTLLGILSVDSNSFARDKTVHVGGSKGDYGFYHDVLAKLVFDVWNYRINIRDQFQHKPNGNGISIHSSRPHFSIRDENIFTYLNKAGIYNIKTNICFKPRESKFSGALEEKLIDIFRRNEPSKSYLLNPPLSDQEMRWYFEGIMAGKAVPINNTKAPQININAGERNEVFYYNMLIFARKMGFSMGTYTGNVGSIPGGTSNRIIFRVGDTKKFCSDFRVLNPKFSKICDRYCG